MGTISGSFSDYFRGRIAPRFSPVQRDFDPARCKASEIVGQIGTNYWVELVGLGLVDWLGLDSISGRWLGRRSRVEGWSVGLVHRLGRLVGGFGYLIIGIR